jgi:acylphosphatase
MTRVRLRIHGYVQGVSFRYYARQRAQMLSLTGWVRNCPDGTVEVVAEGADDAVRQFVSWAHRGPSAAEVERVDVDYEDPRGEPPSFRIVH